MRSRFLSRFAGSEVRPIGVLRMVRPGQGRREDPGRCRKRPALSRSQGLFPGFRAPLREIEHFFSIYKNLEGKKTEIAGWDGVDAARQMITEGQKRFN
jgi:inorganic pyrophosphatase